jgi:hypothetical protein
MLKFAGYDESAEQVDKLKKRIKIKTDPLTLAVSLGLINPSVLEILESDKKEDDEAINVLLKQLKQE